MKCCVKSCRNKYNWRRKENNICFLRFPKDETTQKKWLELCGITPPVLPSMRVCQDHFEKNDFIGNTQLFLGLRGRPYLKPGAIPCINIMGRERAKRIEKRNNKKLVDELLKSPSLSPIPEQILENPFAEVSLVPEINDVKLGQAEMATAQSDTLALSSNATVTIFYPGEDKVTNINKCRTCDHYFVADINAKDLYDQQNSYLLNHIELITSVKIMLQDGLPRHICSGCSSDLNKAIEFRERCIKMEAQIMLQMPLKRSPVDIAFSDNEEQCEFAENSAYVIENSCSYVEELGPSNLPITKTENLKKERKTPQPDHGDKETIKQEGDDCGLSYDPLNFTNISLGDTIFTCLNNRPLPAKKNNKKKSEVQKRSRPKKAPKEKIEKPKKIREKRKNKPGIYVCDQCGKICRYRASFMLHKKRHTGVKPHQCPECPKSFLVNNLLNIHIRVVHRGEKPFPCRYCKNSYSEYGGRRNHEIKCHGAPSRVIFTSKTKNENSKTKSITHYPCPDCNKSYSSESSLKWHLNWHTGTYPYICEFCDKRFTNPNRAKLHEMTHKPKTHVCEVCQKSYSSILLLNKHKQVAHSGERPYKCDVCKTSYATQAHCYRHRKSFMHKHNLQKCASVENIEELNN